MNSPLSGKFWVRCPEGIPEFVEKILRGSIKFQIEKSGL
jgi:hypothetical protein